MGAGPELLHRWGHAALCVIHRDSPESDVCYNYGAAFPTSIASLGWQFLRGTARFMVIRQQYSEMLSIYQGDDRSVWIQRLPFTQAQVKRMMDLLENDLIEENRYYVYHHMWDNCATRLRGHIDTVVGGRLRREGRRGVGVTYRELAQRGLAGRPLLLVGTTLAFGRGLDQEVTAWASMGHPDYLRREVARQLRAKPEAIYVRQGAPLPDAASAGHPYLVVLAILLALGVVLARRQPGPLAARRLLRGFAVAAKLLLISFGVLLWLTALATTVRELWLNEALLVFLPTDVLLLRLTGTRLQWYLRLRLAGLAVVGILLLSGVFVQPLLSALLLPGLICVASLTPRLTPRPEGPLAEEQRKQGTWKQRSRKKEMRTGASGGKPGQPSSQKAKKRKRPQAGGPKA